VSDINPAQVLRKTGDFRDEVERLEAEQAAFLANLETNIISGPEWWFKASPWNTPKWGAPAYRYRRMLEHDACHERQRWQDSILPDARMSLGNGLDAVASITVIRNHNGLAAKVFKLNGATGLDGLDKISAAQIYEGTFELRQAQGIAGLLEVINGLDNKLALTYGVPKIEADRGKIVTQRALMNGADEDAIARDRDHFHYVVGAPGVLMLDCDPRKGYSPRPWPELDAILCGVMPELKDVQRAWRPSSSAFIYRTDTDEELIGIGGWRCYLMVDDASRIPDVGALLYQRLWAAGHGYIQLSKAGSQLDRSIIDASVWQPERLDFAAAPYMSVGLERRPPVDVILPGEPMLKTEGIPPCMPMGEWRRSSTVLHKAKNETKPKAEKTRTRFVKERVEEAQRKGHKLSSTVVERAARDQVLSREFIVQIDGGEKTIGELLDDPDRWHEMRMPDPMEPEYASDPRIAIAYIKQHTPIIWSWAHGGITYRLINTTDEALNRETEDKAEIERLAALSKLEYGKVRKPKAKEIGIPVKILDEEVEKARKEARKAAKMTATAIMPDTGVGVSMTDFYAVLPQHQYLFVPTRALWSPAAINGLFGDPADIEPPSQTLDQSRGVQAMTWAPGLPLIVENRLICDGGWIDRLDCRTLNLYRPPVITSGDPNDVALWLDHIKKIYPVGHEHVLDFLAHRVQRPQEKINHALVLGGSPNIGKDTILEPVKHAIGPWNFKEASPKKLLERFNPFLQAVILRVSEASDLGEFDRFALYEATKVMWAAPPDTLMVDDKHIKMYPIVNVLGGIVTTNHRTDGLYLPPDDRRHYVLWSDSEKDDFTEDYWNKLWRWYDHGGFENVAAFLRTRDISQFNPKKPPEKTAAFWAIVDNARAPEEGELRDELEALGWPKAITLEQVINASKGLIGGWLSDRKNARAVPHKFERCGYIVLRNDGSDDGRWKVGGKNKTIYVRKELSPKEQHKAAAELIEKAAGRR